jgi:hypothetical protein
LAAQVVRGRTCGGREGAGTRSLRGRRGGGAAVAARIERKARSAMAAAGAPTEESSPEEEREGKGILGGCPLPAKGRAKA